MCYFCGADYTERVYKNTLCPSCDKELKICLNCKFYDPSAHWECRETISEPVRDKDRANFCDYFQYVLRKGTTGKEEKKRSQARESFDSLFND